MGLYVSISFFEFQKISGKLVVNYFTPLLLPLLWTRRFLIVYKQNLKALAL